MLVDFGTAPGKGGTTAIFPSIARDVAAFCNGHLHLLVMTHEHLDQELLLAWREATDPAGAFAATAHVPFPHPDAA
jgi:hypothetical protein